jgi:hypothetical protein
LKDSKRSDANVVNRTSFDKEECAFSLSYALHLEHSNAIGFSSASKTERNWFSAAAHATHTMSSTTISHAEIKESDVATWYANFDVMLHMTDKLDWFTC